MILSRFGVALACLSLAGLPASAQEDGPTADELMAAIDEAVSEAEVMRVEFSSSATGGPGGGVDMEGEMIMGLEGRFRMTMSGNEEAGGGTFEMQMISDGEQRKMIMEQGGMPSDSVVEAIDDEDRAMMGLLRTSLARAGACMLFMIGRPPEEDEPFQIQQLERLEDAELDGATVYVVRYLLSMGAPGPTAGEMLDVTVWIDPDTGMPVKRSMSAKSPDGQGQFQISETYSAFEADPELPDDVFDLGGE